MILISHRGNLNGKIPERENRVDYIEDALALGYEVEIDVWLINDSWYLGHDNPEYPVEYEWLNGKKEALWIHCKNTDALVKLNSLDSFNYFWHENDTAVLTSKKYVWTYPGKQPINNSVAVMPEIHNEDISSCAGICSDYITKYKTWIKK